MIRFADDIIQRVAVRVSNAGLGTVPIRADVAVTHGCLGAAALVLIGGSQDLVSLQAPATHQSVSDGCQDVVFGFAIHPHEVVSIHLPDKGPLEAIMVAIPNFDIHRVLIVIGDPVLALVHVGGEIASIPVTILLVMDIPIFLPQYNILQQ